MSININYSKTYLMVFKPISGDKYGVYITTLKLNFDTISVISVDCSIVKRKMEMLHCFSYTSMFPSLNQDII